jgi:hypothetical protein
LTAPVQAGGGLQVTVTKQGTLLTEYAPVTVINIGSDRLWLAANSSVAPGNGVPLDAGTSYDWATPGILYAAIDPAATDTTAQVVLTGSGGSWSPSPVAIGVAVATQIAASGLAAATGVQVADQLVLSGLAAATGVQVAQQLLAGGLPVVAKTSTLFHGVGLPLNTSTGQLTCTGYSSLYLRLSPGLYNTVVQQLIIDWRDSPGGPIVASDEIDTTGTGNIQNFTMPCRADNVTITSICSAAPLFSLDVIASTRFADRIRSNYTSFANTQLLMVTSIFVSSGGTQVASLSLPIEGPTSWTVFCPTLTGTGAVLNVSCVSSGGTTQFQQYLTTGQMVRFITYSPMMAQYLQLATSSTANITVAATAARIPV